MKTSRWLACLLVVGAAALLTACGPYEPGFTSKWPGVTDSQAELKPVVFTNGIRPDWLRTPTNLFTLGPGDKLDIEYLGETNTTITTTVGPDGKIYFNLLPGLDVWGLTLAQTK